MMKTIFTLSFLFFINNITFSQEKNHTPPDYQSIKKNIEDKNSNFYYPKLMDRMIANDPSLNIEDYKHLYYGYVFSPKYNAFYRFADEDKLSKYYQSSKINEEDYDDIIKLTEKAINQFPFDLMPMNFLGYIYHLKGDEISAKNISDRFKNIISAIISTGIGSRCDSGIHVISVSHEYVLLNLLEFQPISQSLIGNCDYFKFEQGKYKIDGFYFNIEKMLENEMKQFGGK